MAEIEIDALGCIVKVKVREVVAKELEMCGAKVDEYVAAMLALWEIETRLVHRAMCPATDCSIVAAQLETLPAIEKAEPVAELNDCPIPCSEVRKQ